MNYINKNHHSLKNLTKEDYIIIGKMWEMKSNLSIYRILAALKLGRPLKKDEIVHHINGNHSDDRSENLKICCNKIEHRFQHSNNPNNIIKKCRIKNNYSQKNLAKKLKINVALLSQIETGLVLPSFDMLLEIARILDCLITDLYHKEDLEIIKNGGRASNTPREIK